MEYVHRVKPFKHQEFIFNKTCDDEVHGYLWEQGTAKTKPVIDTACWLYLNKKISGLVVVAPNGVHFNWLTDELPEHLPDAVRGQVMAIAYETKKANTKKYQRQLDELLNYDGLAIIAVSYDGFVTKKGKEFLKKFLTKRKCIHVLDEAHHVKTPSAQRTRTILASGRYGKYRRIMTGTPCGNSPFDLYSLMRFLKPDFWHPLGIRKFSQFKAYFGIWETGYNYKTKQDYDILVKYKNIKKLNAMIQPYTSRYLKEDVSDLPPKLYQKRYVEMTKEQRDMYRQLEEEFAVTWDDSGEEIYAELALVRLLRFQQITCGYFPEDDEKGANLKQLDGRNPKLEVLDEIVEELIHPAIIWARFIKDIDLIMEKYKDIAVRYDGTQTDEQNEEAKRKFKAGEAKLFIGNPAKGSEGITLHMAKTVIYYNNSFKLIHRLQSEDRAHRAGMDDNPVNYIDIIAKDTVDERIVGALRSKFNIAAEVTGDQIRSWI